MEKLLISEINRINEIMGLSVITEASNPFVILLRNAAKGLETEISTILGRTISSVDEISAQDISILLRSKNEAVRQLSTKVWGIGKREFNNKTFEELAQDLSQRGLPKSQINRYIKNAGEVFGEPKGGFPPQSILKGSQQIHQQGLNSLNDVELLLNNLVGSSKLTPEQKEFYDKMNIYLKRANLPKVKEKDIDLLVDNTKALISKLTIKGGDNFPRLFSKLDDLTKEIETYTSSQQKRFLTILIREVNSNPSLAKRLTRYFVPWKDSRWSTDFMATWNESIKITKWFLLTSTAMDIIRGFWDYFKDREFKGHFGMEFPASFATKLVFAGIPYINVLASLYTFGESAVRTIKGDKPSKNSEESSTVEDLMQNQQSSGQN